MRSARARFVFLIAVVAERSSSAPVGLPSSATTRCAEPC